MKRTLRIIGINPVIFTILLSVSSCTSSTEENSTSPIYRADDALGAIIQAKSFEWTVCIMVSDFYDYLSADKKIIDRPLTIAEAKKILSVIKDGKIDYGLNLNVFRKYIQEAVAENDIDHIRELTDHMNFFECGRAWRESSNAEKSAKEGNAKVDIVYKALRSGCRNLPTYLTITYVGDGPKANSGTSSTLYSANQLLQLALFDVNDHWEVGAWPISDASNREAARKWDCGAGGDGAVLGIYVVNK